MLGTTGLLRSEYAQKHNKNFCHTRLHIVCEAPREGELTWGLSYLTISTTKVNGDEALILQGAWLVSRALQCLNKVDSLFRIAVIKRSNTNSELVKQIHTPPFARYLGSYESNRGGRKFWRPL